MRRNKLRRFQLLFAWCAVIIRALLQLFGKIRFLELEFRGLVFQRHEWSWYDIATCTLRLDLCCLARFQRRPVLSHKLEGQREHFFLCRVNRLRYAFQGWRYWQFLLRPCFFRVSSVLLLLFFARIVLLYAVKGTMMWSKDAVFLVGNCYVGTAPKCAHFRCVLLTFCKIRNCFRKKNFAQQS